MDLPLFLVMTVLVPAAGAFMVPAAGAAMAAVVGTGNVWLIAKPAFQIFLPSGVLSSSNSALGLNASRSHLVVCACADVSVDYNGNVPGG